MAIATGVRTGVDLGRVTTYTGESLRCLAMPMGGLGAGQVSLAGDGSLRQWQISHEINHSGFVPHTFFAVWAKPHYIERPPPVAVARVLQTDVFYDSDFEPAPAVNDHEIPAGCRELLEALPGVEDIRYRGTYPFADLEYVDAELPVQISMEAFTPFIPLDARASGLPAVIFNLTVHNPGDVAVDVAFMGTAQNSVGWDGVTGIDGVSWPGYEGNRNSTVRLNGISAVDMTSSGLDPRHPKHGHVTLAALTDDAPIANFWDDPEALWATFGSRGTVVEVGESPASAPGRTWNAAVAPSVTVQPGESQTITFVLAWHFPNRYVNWGQSHLGMPDADSRFFEGAMYTNWFGSALAVVEHIRDNLDDLSDASRLYRDSFFDSTLPAPVLETISTQTSILRSPTYFWPKDGNFYAFEGCNGASTSPNPPHGGCCPLNCTHVLNYEQALSRLFPDLERTQRDLEFGLQMTGGGGIPHRVVLPLEMPRWGSEYEDCGDDCDCDEIEDLGSIAHHNENAVYACDGHFGAILKAYREYLQSGDHDWLAAIWPRIKLSLEYAIDRWDDDRDGILSGAQWNTYDCVIFGHSSFTTSLYLAALLAVETIAIKLGDAEQAASAREMFDKSAANIDAELYNGEFYFQTVDHDLYSAMQYGDGCHADQLLGQWWAHALGLGHLLPVERVNSAVNAIHKYNFRHDLLDHVQRPRVYVKPEEPGVLLCTWPNGGELEDPTNYSHETAWTGVEYAVASQLIYEGLVDEGLEIVTAIRSRQNGHIRNPWNEVECGDHYARALASWNLLDALSGYFYDAGAAALTVGPRLSPEDYRAFFIGNGGWGSYSQVLQSTVLSARLGIAWGEVELSEFTLALPEGLAPESVGVSLAGADRPASWDIVDGELRLVLEDVATIAAGAELVVTASA